MEKHKNTEIFYVFDNFTKDTTLFLNGQSNQEIKKRLSKFIYDKLIKGAFFTYYNNLNTNDPHIKIGLWLYDEPGNEIEKIKKDRF